MRRLFLICLLLLALRLNAQTAVPCSDGKGCLTGIIYNQNFIFLIGAPTSIVPAGYNLYRSGTSGSTTIDPYVKVNASLITSTTYTDTSVIATGKTYYYVVTAVDSTGKELGFANIEMIMSLSPSTMSITTLNNLSPSGKIYTGFVIPINGNGFTTSCVVNVDGVAQSPANYAFSSSTLINFTVPASLGNSTGVAHTLTVSC